MSAYLLDVNVLVAMLWPAHESHAAVQRWFVARSRRGWATCPFTEAGFVRIVSNPAFSSDAVTPEEALRVLQANLKHPGHRFWSDDIGLVEAVEHFRPRLVGHRQVTDAYLLGLALRRRGKLVTLDRGVLALLTAQSPEREHLEVIGDGAP